MRKYAIFFALMLVSCAMAQEWMMFGYDAGNTGSTSARLPDDLSLLWTYETAGALDEPAVVAGGMIVFGSQDTNVYALDEATGMLLWRFDCSGKPRAAAISGGMVYITTYDGEIYALDRKDGELLWAQRTRIDSLSSPKIVGGKLFISSREVVQVFDALSGNVLWTYQLPYNKAWPPDLTAAAAIHDGKVFVSSEYGDVYALDEASGGLVWKTELVKDKGALVYPEVFYSPAAAYGKLFVSGRPGLYVFDEASGRILWDKVNPSKYRFRSLAVAGDLVFVSARNGRIYAFEEKTGEIRWERKCPGPTTPVVSGDKLVYACADKTLSIIDRATGSVLWSYTLEDEGTGGFVAQPTVANGKIFLPSYDGKLYVFGAAANVSYVVRSSPDGAEIFVDNRPMGLTPSTIAVSLGIHRIRVIKKDYVSWSDYVKVGEADEGIDVTLEKLPSAEKKLAQTLTIGSVPSGAGVYFDGKYVGKTPVTINASPAYHQVKLVKSQFKIGGAHV
jgi:outer membrane protein assembly factor BamB